MEAAHPRVAAADGANLLRRAVARIVVDEDRFPFDAGEHRFEALEQRLDVLALIKGRNDDGKLGRTPGTTRRGRLVGEFVFGQCARGGSAEALDHPVLRPCSHSLFRRISQELR